MIEHIPAEQRLYRRIRVELMGQYFLVGRSDKHLGCTIVDLSRSGAGALFPGKEKIQAGDIILLDMITPSTFQRISVEGEIRRSYRRGNAVFAGMQFQAILNAADFHALCDTSAEP